MIRVANVKGINRPEDRAAVVYCGRAFAGWAEGPFANPFSKYRHADPLARYREWVAAWRRDRPAEFDEALRELWGRTGHGARPLGCWCGNFAAGDGSPVVCHAQIVAELLRERFGGECEH